MSPYFFVGGFCRKLWSYSPGISSFCSSNSNPFMHNFCPFVFTQVMTQYGFFNSTGTVILVVVLHSWNYLTNKREGVSHFMITDDLKKTNMQVCKFIEDLFFEYDAQHLAQADTHLQHLVIFSDNCGYQFKSRWVFTAFKFKILVLKTATNFSRCTHFLLLDRQQLAWMAEFVESAAHELVSIMHNFSAAQHGKGPADFEAGKVYH